MMEGPPKGEDAHHHHGIGLERTAGNHRVREEKIICDGDHGTIHGNQSAHKQEEKYSTHDPEQRRINAGDPKMFAGKTIREGNNVFQNGRLHIGTRLPLLDGHLSLPGGNVRRACGVIHAARFEHRKQLARRLEIQRQVRQLI